MLLLSRMFSKRGDYDGRVTYLMSWNVNVSIFKATTSHHFWDNHWFIATSD